MGVFVRPYCQDFLRRMSRKFTVVVFTASNQEYADKIIDKLDPDNEYISSRFYRYHCTFHDGKQPSLNTQFEELYIKDLRLFSNRELSDLIIIDNIICSYSLQIRNGIPIKPYCYGKTDFELKYIADQLEGMKKYMRCEEYIERKFKLRKFYEFLC